VAKDAAHTRIRLRVKFSLRDLESRESLQKSRLFLIVDPSLLGPDYRRNCQVRRVNKCDIAQGHLFASAGARGDRLVPFAGALRATIETRLQSLRLVARDVRGKSALYSILRYNALASIPGSETGLADR